MSDIEDDSPQAWLAHYGVRGMKWGVRRRYNEKQGNRVRRLDRVAKGKGSAGDKLKALGESSLLELAANGGLKNTARIHSEATKKHLQRVNSGKKKAADLLIIAGNLSLGDVLAGGRDKYRKAK